MANGEVNDEAECRLGPTTLVASDVTDSVEWDDKESREVELDRACDVIELVEKDMNVEVVAEGFPMVAAPSSKRADGVLQHLVPSKFDSQQ